jgi:sensor histidine kinase YesM
MSEKKVTWLHLFIWLFAVFANLPYSDLGQDMSKQQIISYVFAFLYLMLVFYLFYLVLVPSFLEKKKLALFFTFSFFTVLLMPFFGYSGLFLIRALSEGSFNHFYRDYSFGMHLSGYFPVLTAAVFGSFFRVIISWFSALNQKAESDRQRLAAELELLKSKLNPHFLFNTLNNIDALITSDPALASEQLIRLSDMMRYLTYETASDTVELSRELDYISAFIELNRIRISDPGTISFMAEGDTTVRLAPALFVPVIENAFKYATFRKQKPAIGISVGSTNGIITLTSFNSYDCENRKSKTVSGFGLSGLRRRLDLIYPGKHNLEINTDNEIFTLKLTIDTNADQMHRN